MEVYIRRSKTDQEGRGSIFRMSGESMGGFSIPKVHGTWRVLAYRAKITCFQGSGEQKTAGTSAGSMDWCSSPCIVPAEEELRLLWSMESRRQR